MSTAEVPRVARQHFGDIAGSFATITDEVLFGKVWADPALSPRERSLLTVAALVTAGRRHELLWHYKRALDNGLTLDDLAAAITHLAFYAGWPCANSAVNALREVIEEINASQAGPASE